MALITRLLLTTLLGASLLAAGPASTATAGTPAQAPALTAASRTTAHLATMPAAKYWSCSRIENEFVSIIGAWGANPALGPQVDTAMRALITHVKNKATKRLMRQVLLVQDPLAPDSAELFNTILTRIARGQC